MVGGSLTMKRAMRDRTTAKRLGLKTWQLFMTMGLCSGLLASCVSSEKYEAEKSRALNFQRLLAQEEKRTGELNVQVQEARRQTASLGTQNRDLTTELQGLRDQMVRQQEELAQMREQSSQMEATATEDLTLSEASLSEFGLGDISFEESDFQEVGFTETVYYTVVRGDTLYQISREYGVTVNDLLSWNNLDGDLISVGQRLVVSSP